MNIQILRVTLAIIMMVLSLGMLALGIKVTPGKPFLLRTRIYLAGIVLLFTMPTTAAVVGMWPLDWVSILANLVVLVVLVPLFILFTYRSIGDIIVYNTTEAMVREALEEVLNERGLAYCEGDRPGLLSRIFAELYTQTKFSLALRDLDSSILVTITPLGVANLRFTKKPAIPNYRGLIASLESKLQAKECDGIQFSGCLMFVGSVIMMGGSIYLLLS